MSLAGATWRYVLYDILRDLRQRFANADFSEYQVMYWIMVHADRLRKQHIQKIDSGEYLAVFGSVAVSTDASGNKYITIPARVYDFDLDRGISYITYSQGTMDENPQFTGITFGRTTPADSKRLFYREEEAPSPANPYFYRAGDKIYFLGTEDVPMQYAEVGIIQTLNPADTTLDLDDAVDLPQDLIPVLKRQVLDLGVFALQIPEDLKNDGVNQQTAVPQKKFASVDEFRESERES